MDKKTKPAVSLRFRSWEDLEAVKEKAKEKRLSVNSYILHQLLEKGDFEQGDEFVLWQKEKN